MLFFQNQAMQDIYDGRGMKVNPVRDISVSYYLQNKKKTIKVNEK